MSVGQFLCPMLGLWVLFMQSRDNTSPCMQSVSGCRMSIVAVAVCAEIIKISVVQLVDMRMWAKYYACYLLVVGMYVCQYCWLQSMTEHCVSIVLAYRLVIWQQCSIPSACRSGRLSIVQIAALCNQFIELDTTLCSSSRSSLVNYAVRDFFDRDITFGSKTATTHS